MFNTLIKYLNIIIFLFFSSFVLADGNKLIVLGGASTKGSFWPVSNSICNIVNKDKDIHNFRCLPSVTGGSVYNINAVLTGELDMALAMTNVLHEQYHNTDDGKSLRFLSNLYKEPVLVIVKKEGAIKSFDDIEPSTIINIGNAGSGERVLADKMFTIMNWNKTNFSNLTTYTTNESIASFCNNELDVIVTAIGLPNDNYTYLAKECDAMYISLSDRLLDNFVEGPFYAEYNIPLELSPNNTEAAKTAHTNIILFSKHENSNEMINAVLSSLFKYFDEFAESMPLLSLSTKEYYSSQSIQIPIHSGAEIFYQKQ